MGIKSRVKRAALQIKSGLLDVGKAENVVMLAGMGRSGTTWVCNNILNYDQSYRVLFEPFFPEKVPEISAMQSFQYLHRQASRPELSEQTKAILAGKIRNEWVDQQSHSWLYRRRLIKAIRGNMMLGWLKDLAPRTPLILLIRHPLQVASSWMQLGWDRHSKLETVISQPSLLDDIPLVAEVLREIDKSDYLQRIVFRWCVYHYVPLQQLQPHEVHAVYYENMLLRPQEEVQKLFQYLNRKFEPKALEEAMGKMSSTNFLNKSANKGTLQFINTWQEKFTSEQIRRAREITAAFGLDKLYDSDGLPTSEAPFYPQVDTADAWEVLTSDAAQVSAREAE